MQKENEGVRLNIALLLSPEENEALKKRISETGVKQYCFVRELIRERLVKENYLPNPQM